MTIEIKDTVVNYIQYGSGKDIVLLHGWGQNIEMMKPLGDKLKKDYRITILDLPGFGESSEPKEEFSIYDYCELVKECLEKLEIANPVLMGHSFGGRVAIVYSSKYQVEKLVLFGSPCIRKEQKESLKLKMLKSLKKVPGLNKLENVAKKYIGSEDYRHSSIMMRKILVKVVNEDLSECAQKISCPTLLIWGSNDEQAPVEDARELEKIISDAGLIVYDGGTHYAYLEFLGPIINVLKNFL